MNCVTFGVVQLYQQFFSNFGLSRSETQFLKSNHQRVTEVLSYVLAQSNKHLKCTAGLMFVTMEPEIFTMVTSGLFLGKDATLK